MTSEESSPKAPGLILAMGGAEERLQIVLGKPEGDSYRMLASREWNVPGESNRFLTPGLKDMLDSFGLSMSDIDRVACVRGPGSFTGLRLVLAAAEGLAAGCGAKLAGIDHLRYLASGPAQITNGILHVVTYARRGIVYIQSFNVPSMREAQPLTYLPVEEAVERIKAISDTAMIMGSGLRKNIDYFQNLAETNQGFTLLPKAWDTPSPEVLLEAAVAADYSEDSIEPCYVRASDAEDNLPFIAKKRGLDPEKAKQRLKELQQS
ncbi:tRNA (adenosine(37)-N6)-threonylcarbamoyltransferase complex dimerization subunit type 1 TsaB [Pseudodesulfovibrio sp. zrk46]|uniref:tRNA (adenosine(37)-N6)-threonylcarbamoyltransferase complex dimerization subunit type 1 TsaB n=1 Tax=Pseudodesulfovibrio sp. zrk46 TaxID=2725288 RepID=UPI001448CBAD|nr:tRNA (adenosine(37)-N6)-threonylcarbamoyltransferase complex dimerization subunit type 1 TsaB [Pseudodesulfovibrio sp. zrk46]QJB58113.1 tRNA (adenosine(37)-N6)-threonylcarbamoyltransferase complex dimerization subunit type 1 TsaB [Pseudodesulfovibrio sp. zrk46]